MTWQIQNKKKKNLASKNTFKHKFLPLLKTYAKADITATKSNANNSRHGCHFLQDSPSEKKINEWTTHEQMTQIFLLTL